MFGSPSPNHHPQSKRRVALEDSCPRGAWLSAARTQMMIAWAVVTTLPGCDFEPRNGRNPSGFFETLPQWDVAELSELEVGSTLSDGTELEGRLQTVLGSDGGLVVADGQSRRLVRIGPSGDVIWKAGGTGSGPGEFRTISKLSWEQDGSVLAWDEAYQRVTAVDLESGRVIETHRVVADVESILPEAVGFSQDGLLFLVDRASAVGRRAEPERVVREDLPVLAWYPPREAAVEVARVRDSERYFYNRDRGWGYVPTLFGPRTFVAVSGDGVVVVTTEEGTAQRVSSSGDLGPSHRVRLPRVGVTPEMVAAERADLVEARREALQLQVRVSPGFDLESTIRQYEEVVRELPVHPVHPGVNQVVGTPEGYLWLEVPSSDSPEEAGLVWLILNPDLEPVGWTVTPDGKEVMDIRGERVTLRNVDALGLETLTVHRIQRGASR